MHPSPNHHGGAQIEHHAPLVASGSPNSSDRSASQALAMTSDYHAEAVRRFVATEPPLFNAGP